MKLSSRSASGKRQNQSKKIPEFVCDALNGVTKIESFLHFVKLNYNRNTYKDFLKEFKNVNFHVAGNSERIKMPNYQTVGYGTFKKTKFSIYKDPQGCLALPLVVLTCSSPRQQDLHYLSCKYPQISLSLAEYATDIFCDSKENVSKLFYLLRRYMYFLNCGRTRCIGGKFEGITVSRNENCVWYVGTRNSSDQSSTTRKSKNKAFTIYERGSDDLKNNKGWSISDIDRVRIEYLAKQQNKVFSRLKINELQEFVKNPKFYDMVSKKYQFRRFNSNNDLPSDHEDFKSKDISGNIECFQEEFHNAKQKFTNVTQYTEKVEYLKKFKEQIDCSMEAFDGEWISKYNKHVLKSE